ncbi:MAG: HpcH/HpaI aldolase family protein [Caulobacteraceae bacterium]
MVEGLRARVRGGEIVLGAFIKTAAHQVGELMGRAGLDFAIIDAEHAAFDLTAIDRVVLGGLAAGLACLVRPPDGNASFIGQCLDLGAAGVLAPHIAGAEAARRLVAAARYSGGRRGFSPSTRAGGYGAKDAAAHRRQADLEASLWCQIEDAEALAHLDAIAAVDEVDCLFLGRADLALSLGVERHDDPKVLAAVQATTKAARRHGRAVGVYIGDTAEMPALLAQGITVFACGSDQSFLLAQGRRNRADLERAIGGGR